MQKDMETLENLTETPTKAKLTFSQADFPVSLFPQSEKEKAEMTSVFYGEKCIELSRKLNLPSLLAKTLVNYCEWKNLGRYYLTWRYQVIKSKYSLFLLTPLVRHTTEKEFGLLPTPRANMGIQIGKEYAFKPMKKGTADSLPQAIARHIYTNFPQQEKFCLHPSISEMVMGYPMGWTEITHLETQ